MSDLNIINGIAALREKLTRVMHKRANIELFQITSIKEDVDAAFKAQERYTLTQITHVMMNICPDELFKRWNNPYRYSEETVNSALRPDLSTEQFIDIVPWTQQGLYKRLEVAVEVEETHLERSELKYKYYKRLLAKLTKEGQRRGK